MTPEDFFEKSGINSALEQFYETDQLFDLTNRRTFIAASAIAILCGIMIGIGYSMVFAQFPNVTTMTKFNIFLITLFVGIGAGAGPWFYRMWHNSVYENSKEEDDGE